MLCAINKDVRDFHCSGIAKGDLNIDLLATSVLGVSLFSS